MSLIESPLVSVIILNHNGAHLLREEFPGLASQDYPAIEIIVVDNGSHDDSSKVAESYGARFLSLGRNLYFGAGNNEGAKIARGEFLYFVNNDMRFPENVVSGLVRAISSDQTIFSGDIKQYDWQGTRLFRAGTRVMTGSLVRGNLPGLEFDVHFETRKALDIPYSSGASLFCRKWMFDVLGGFDRTFYFDNEDLDLCWRAWMRGWRSVYVPDLYCFHRGGASFGENPYVEAGRQQLTSLGLLRRESRAKNLFRFALKALSWRMVALVWLKQALTSFVYLLRWEPKRSMIFLKAWRKIIDELPEILCLRNQIKENSVFTSRLLIKKFLAVRSKP